MVAAALSGTPADTTVHLPRNGAVEIDTRDRDVVLHTGTTDQVIIRGGSGELDGGTLQVDDGMRRGRGAVDVTVPVWAKVEITSISGNIALSGTSAMLEAQTVNGFIHLNGGSGSADLETVAGDVTVSDFHGNHLTLSTTGNAITIINSSGEIDAENVNGNVTLQGVHSAKVSASTVNGAITFEGTFAPNGNYDFESQNRDVTLTLPGDVSARMRISTMSGKLISPQIPATISGSGDHSSQTVGRARHKGDKGDKSDASDDGEQDFTVVYGSGSARVTIDVFNGNVVVHRAP
jgi:DUF4097 and DUF4098 domain-containing protein YvlB